MTMQMHENGGTSPSTTSNIKLKSRFDAALESKQKSSAPMV